MPPNQNKLENLRNKSEREKHFLAVVGASIFTGIIVLFWGYTFFSTVGEQKEIAKNSELNEQFSPFASFKSLFNETTEEIKIGSERVKDSASVIFFNAENVSETNQ